MDPTYKVVLLMWAKDLLETAVLAAIAFPVMRKLVKNAWNKSVEESLVQRVCPHCGKNSTPNDDRRKGDSGTAGRGREKSRGSDELSSTVSPHPYLLRSPE
jgi:hypothetical protein